MVRKTPSARVLRCASAGLVSLIVFVVPPALARSVKPMVNPCGVPSPSLEMKMRCAVRVGAAVCSKTDENAVAALSKALRISPARLMRALRLRNLRASTPKRLCELSAADFLGILQIANTTEKHADSPQEWMRFTMGDKDGIVAPGGLARALEQRREILHRNDRVEAFSESRFTVLPSSASGWTNLTGYEHPVGRINALLVHPTIPSTMWAGADGGGIWKTTDSGNSWTPANDFLASMSISSFAMTAANPSIVYAATGAHGSHTGAGGDGIFKSTDGGSTWSQLLSTDPATHYDFDYVYSLAIHPTDANTVLAGTVDGAYITTNGGSTWTKIAATAGNDARSVAIHPANPNLRVVAVDDGTVRVATDGATYNSYRIASYATYVRIALAPSDQNVMYALVRGSLTTELYRSADRGQTWNMVHDVVDFKNSLSFTGALWIDPSNPNHIAIGELAAWVTPDTTISPFAEFTMGLNWADMHGFTTGPNGSLYAFDDGGLYLWSSADSMTGTPSYLATHGMVITEVYGVAGQGSMITFGAQDVSTRYYHPTDTNPVWHRGTIGADGGTVAIDPTNPNIAYGETQFGGLLRTQDGGLSNAFICQGITDVNCGSASGYAAFVAPFVLDPNNSNRMLAGASSLWRSNDVATGAPPSWSIIRAGTDLYTNITAIAIAPTDSNVIWVAYDDGSLVKTTNGTAAAPTWSQVFYSNNYYNIVRIYIDRTNASHVWVAYSGFQSKNLQETKDGGTTWTDVTGLPAASVFAITQHPTNASWLYVGTVVGLFASQDGGKTWTTTNQGPANVQVRDLSWYSTNPAVLLLGTYGRGVWQATMGGGTLAAPGGLTANVSTTTSVNLGWSVVSGATGYKIYRSSSYPTFTQIGTSTSATYTDSTAAAGTAYLYRVRATNGTIDSADSNADLATTIIFTDPRMLAGAVVKAVHVSQLRSAVNAVRLLAGASAAAFTDPTLSSAVTIKAAHITQLRTALNSARTTLGLPAVSYTDPLLAAGASIKLVHINDLRQAVK